MKKLFLLFLLCITDMAIMAEDYVDELSVVLNGYSLPTDTNTITVEKQNDGSYTMLLKNFILKQDDGNDQAVGTITLQNVEACEVGSDIILRTSQTITITNGDLEGVYFWLGPYIGEVPVDLTGRLNGDRFYALITINLENIGAINVTFGDRFQPGNGNFEYFHTASTGTKTSDEPNRWHSFMSCTGTMASLVSGTAHTFISEDTRPESTGNSSVLVTSSSILGVTANGTLTTGRMKAGSLTATSTDNNAFLDLTSTDKDANGDPFYTLLEGKPDSIVVWVKFKQGKVDAENPYATITSVLTDGSFYQEPQDKDYSSITVARADNTQIESLEGIWQRLSLPFVYDSYGATDPKAILITLSTNAYPGGGSGTDSLWIDDLELVYNASLSKITINNSTIDISDPDSLEYNINVDYGKGIIATNDIDVTLEGNGAFAIVEVSYPESPANGSLIEITIMSEDLRISKTYTITVTPGTYDGVNSINTVSSTTNISSKYDLNSRPSNALKKGNIYIIKRSDGTNSKIITR